MLFLSCFIGPTFDVSINSDTTSVYPWETAKMVCDVSVSGTSPTTGEYTQIDIKKQHRLVLIMN